ncbi:MAG: hypothetical protein NUK65_11630 [Firmicutes bacterium]|nr:hypothetical protein [Bacillota bacterium]
MLQKNKRHGLYAIALFSVGLLLGVALGSLTGALPHERIQQSPKIAEGAGLWAEELAEGPGNYGEVVDEPVYQGYLGVFEDHIAIYDGLPPHGVLQHVMIDYEVRGDVRPQLEAGIPFTDTYDLLRLLENYTS